MSGESLSGSLGSLAQSARSKELNQARVLLIIIGLLTLGANVFFYTRIEKEFDEAVRKELGPNMVIIDQEAFAQARDSGIRTAKAITMGFAAMGAVFIALGAMVYTAPVPITMTAMVLYVGGFALTAYFDPTTIPQGIIIKVIIIVALAKAIQSALAFQKAKDQSMSTGMSLAS